MEHVIKMQYPLIGQGILLYNEDRSLSMVVEDDEVDPILVKKLKKEKKCYFYYHIEKNKGLFIDGVALGQTW